MTINDAEGILTAQRNDLITHLARERNSFHKKPLTFPRCCGREVREVLHELCCRLRAAYIRGQGPDRKERGVAFMKEDTKRALRLVGLASTLGLTIVIATFIGLALGLWLDRVFNTSPWLTVIFLILGIIAGFRNFYRFMSKRAKE